MCIINYYKEYNFSIKYKESFFPYSSEEKEVPKRYSCFRLLIELSSNSLQISRSQSSVLIFMCLLLNLLYSLIVSLTSGLFLSTAFSIYFFLNSFSLVSNLHIPALLCSSSMLIRSIFSYMEDCP